MKHKKSTNTFLDKLKINRNFKRLFVSSFLEFRFKIVFQSFQKWFDCDDAHKFQSNIHIQKKKAIENPCNRN